MDFASVTVHFSGGHHCGRRGGYSVDLDLSELQTTWGGPASPSGDYNIGLVATSTTFTGTATPFTSRQTPDGALTIDQDGTKLPADKWRK